MTPDAPTPALDLWNHREFIAGHTAGAAWFTTMKPGLANPEPPCPYGDEVARKLWERGFEWGSDDARESYYCTE